jgi:hypothetical protein
MQIVTKLKTDANQNPYWSAKIINGDNCLMEIHSQTFLWTDNKQMWEMYERCFNRVAKELAKMKDLGAIKSLLLQE